MLEVHAYIKDYVAYQISEKISYERTIQKYEMCLNEFIDDMRIETIEDIDDLTWIDIKQNWINVKRDKLSAASINLRITALRSFFNYLEGKELIKRNVADKIKKEVTKPRSVEVDIEKIKMMLEIVEDEHNEKLTYLSMRNKFIINMLVFVGLRNEELRDMQMTDINFKDGKFKITGKFDKARELSLPTQLITMYREYLMYRNMIETDEDYLFLSKSGRYLGKNSVTDIAKKVSKQAGIDNYVAHSCRHVAASVLLKSGNNIEDVSKILGHSSVTVTSKVYAEQVTGSSREIINNNILLNNQII